MYWAPKTYQLDICTVNGNVKSDEIVTLEKGILYKQKFVVRNKVFPEGITSFPFFHFQVCFVEKENGCFVCACILMCFFLSPFLCSNLFVKVAIYLCETLF